MVQIVIVTKNETLHVDAKDRLWRPGFQSRARRPGPDSKPSDDWRMLGAVEFGRGFTGGTIVRRYSMADVRAGRVPWFFKNGKQRCFVLDEDHGTRRVQMSPGLLRVLVGQ